MSRYVLGVDYFFISYVFVGLYMFNRVFCMQVLHGKPGLLQREGGKNENKKRSAVEK
jgi:hypothetical protein